MAASERTRVAIVGAKGRMGQALMRLATQDERLELVAGLDRSDDLTQVTDNCDVLVEFSHHTVAPALTELPAERNGARRWSSALRATLPQAKRPPVSRSAAEKDSHRFRAEFFHVGVNLLFHLARIASAALDENYDREIVEMHHRHKLDAPSGTARRLAEILLETTAGSKVRHGREGEVGARPRREIGMHAIRGGDVVGDHTVIFAAEGERLELTHRASSRDTFAAGALRAAQWVHHQPPGLYSMQDVLGLK